MLIKALIPTWLLDWIFHLTDIWLLHYTQNYKPFIVKAIVKVDPA